MATPKPRRQPATKPESKAKPQPQPQNTTPPAREDVSATEAARAASPALHPEAANPSSDAVVVPPRGAEVRANPVAQALIVTAKVEGFRRAGRAWSREPKTVSIDEFTPEQVEALLAESMLDVSVVAE